MANAIELMKTIVILLNHEMACESVFSSLTHVLIDRTTNAFQAHTEISLNEICEKQLTISIFFGNNINLIATYTQAKRIYFKFDNNIQSLRSWVLRTP